MSVLSRSHFHDEEAAFALLEGALWPNGAVCAHCGQTDRMTKVKANVEKRIRVGLWRCGHCKKQCTVKVGTVFEHARLPLYKMLQAVHLMCASKKGVSAHQLHRILEVQYKTAWFLAHRIREAMRTGALDPMGGEGKTVEADQTYIGRLADVPKQRGGTAHKNVVFTLVERGGEARSFRIDNASKANITRIMRANIAKEKAPMAIWARKRLEN